MFAEQPLASLGLLIIVFSVIIPARDISFIHIIYMSLLSTIYQDWRNCRAIKAVAPGNWKLVLSRGAK